MTAVKKKDNLVSLFKPSEYVLDKKAGKLIIGGHKLGPPSKRVSLHQKSLKITQAEITRFDKRGDTVHQVVRINHLPTIERVRLHAAEVLYPGKYKIEISYTLPQKFSEAKPSRSWLPSIDEPEAWQDAEVVFKS